MVSNKIKHLPNINEYLARGHGNHHVHIENDHVIYIFDIMTHLILPLVEELDMCAFLCT
jgi:hypothetical protein